MNDITLINGDCLEEMKKMPDKSIDLVLTDPPYGINIIVDGKVGGQDGKTKKAKLGNYDKHNNEWDKEKPKREYFDEIFRISKNQIIFGANHFIESMPINSSCWLVWDKGNEKSPFADCELAWTSFSLAVRKIKYTWNGMIQGNMKEKEKRCHPTQKPQPVMRWVLDNYSIVSDLILDPFMGSGTTGCACRERGNKFIGIEIDKGYYEIAKKRIANTQESMF